MRIDETEAEKRAAEEYKEGISADEPESRPDPAGVCVGVICINSGYYETLSIQMQIPAVASDVEPKQCSTALLMQQT